MKRSLIVFGLVVAILSVNPDRSRAQIIGNSNDLLDDQVTFSTRVLEVREYVSLPSIGADAGVHTTEQIISMTQRPGDPGAFYSVSQNGQVFRITDNGSGQGTATAFANLGSFIDLSSTNRAHGGLRSIAFHPDFNVAGAAGEGKIYASLVTTVANPTANYLGDSTGDRDSVVAELSYDASTGQVGGFRELFRVRNPDFDHPIKQLTFNHTATSGDADYGLLYIGHGDGSVFNSSIGTGQSNTNALGKILRIDPIDPDGAGGVNYSLPGNALALDGDANTLGEIYSYGHRNPHTLTFAEDSAGQSHLIVADMGQDNIDEINIAVNGGNYGWSEREGTFIELDGNGYGVSSSGVGLLTGNDSGNEYIYPALQMDHNDPTNGGLHAGLGGPVIDGTFYFGNFGGNAVDPGGELYGVSLDDLLAQNTALGLGETVDDLTWIDDFEQFQLAFDHDNDPATDAIIFDDFAQLISSEGVLDDERFRTDMRFALAPDGNLLVSSKQTGSIFLVTIVTPIPEPTSFAILAGLTVAGLGWNRRRRG